MAAGFKDLRDDDPWEFCAFFLDAFHFDARAREKIVQLGSRAAPVHKITQPVERDVHCDVSGVILHAVRIA
jgi:hypothetical protein